MVFQVAPLVGTSPLMSGQRIAIFLPTYPSIQAKVLPLLEDLSIVCVFVVLCFIYDSQTSVVQFVCLFCRGERVANMFVAK